MRSHVKSIESLKKLGEEIIKSTFGDCGRSLNSNSGLGEIQKLLLKSTSVARHLFVPPLPSHILQVANKQRISLIEAAIQIRKSPTAADFRKWLWKSRALLFPDFGSDAIAGQRLEEELKEIGEKMRNAGRAEGIFTGKGSLKINIPIFPMISALLPKLKLEELKNDGLDINFRSVRNVPTYEIFMASWFTSESYLLSP